VGATFFTEKRRKDGGSFGCPCGGLLFGGGLTHQKERESVPHPQPPCNGLWLTTPPQHQKLPQKAQKMASVILTVLEGNLQRGKWRNRKRPEELNWFQVKKGPRGGSVGGMEGGEARGFLWFGPPGAVAGGLGPNRMESYLIRGP